MKQYHADRKVATLGIPPEVIERAGTVSPDVASCLARQARSLSDADLGLGVTGVAGPETVEGKPVGRVYVALDSRTGTTVRQWDLPGDRNRVKERAARFAINMVRLHLIGGLEEKL